MRSSEAGRCPLHPDIQLRLQGSNGEWFDILPTCPLCVAAFGGHDRHLNFNSSTATMTAKEHSKKSRRSKKKTKKKKQHEDKCKDVDEEDFGRSLLEEMDRVEAAQIMKQKQKALLHKQNSQRDKNKSTKPILEMDEQGGHERMQTWTPPIHNQIHQELSKKNALEQQRPQEEGGSVKDKINHPKKSDLSYHSSTQSTIAITIEGDEASLTLADMEELPDIEDDIPEEKQQQIIHQTTITQGPQLRRGVGSQGREASTARSDMQRLKVLRALRRSLDMDYHHEDTVKVTSDDAAVVPGEGISKENTVLGHQREDQTSDHQIEPPPLDDGNREPKGGRKGQVVIGNRSRAPSRSGFNTQALARSDASKTTSADDMEAERISASDAIMAKALTKWEAKRESVDSKEAGPDLTGGTGTDADVVSRDVVISEGAEASSSGIQPHDAGSGEHGHIDKSISTPKYSSATTATAATSIIEPENKMRIGETVRQLDISAPLGKLGVTVDTPPSPDGLAYVSSVRDYSVLRGKLRGGDKIVAVDDEDVREMLSTDVCQLLVSNGSNVRRKITVLREVVEIDYDPDEIIEHLKSTTSSTTPKSPGRTNDENSAEGDISSQLPEPEAAKSEEHTLPQTQASKMAGGLRRQAMDLSVRRALEGNRHNVKCSATGDDKIVVSDVQNDGTAASSKADSKFTGEGSDGNSAKEKTPLSDAEEPPRPNPDNAILEEQRIHQAQAQTLAHRQKGVGRRQSMDLTVRRALERSHRSRKSSASDAENDEKFAKEKNIDLNYGSSARTGTDNSGQYFTETNITENEISVGKLSSAASSDIAISRVYSSGDQQSRSMSPSDEGSAPPSPLPQNSSHDQAVQERRQEKNTLNDARYPASTDHVWNSSHPPPGEEVSDSDADTFTSEAPSIDIYSDGDASSFEEKLSVFEQFHEMYPPPRRARGDQMRFVAISAPNLVNDDRSSAEDIPRRAVSDSENALDEVLELCDEFNTTPRDLGVLLPLTHGEGGEDSATIHRLNQQQQAIITHHQQHGTINAGSRLSSRKEGIATKVKWDKRGYCIYHPTVQLRKKKVMRGWKVVQNVCPDCRAKDIDSFLKRKSRSRKQSGSSDSYNNNGSRVSKDGSHKTGDASFCRSRSPPASLARQRQPRRIKKVLNMPFTFSDCGSVLYTGEVDMSNRPSGKGSIFDPKTGFVAKGDWINGVMIGAVDC